MAKKIITAPAYSDTNMRDLQPQVQAPYPTVQLALDKGTVDGKAYDTYLNTEIQAVDGAYAVGFDGDEDNVGDALVGLASAVLAKDSDIQANTDAIDAAELLIQANTDAVDAAELLIQDNTDNIDAITPSVTTGSIPTTGWVAHTGDNALKYDLVITGVTATSWVEITVDIDSQDVAQAAEINPTIVEYAGGVTLYANTAPTAAIPVKIRVVG